MPAKIVLTLEQERIFLSKYATTANTKLAPEIGLSKPRTLELLAKRYGLSKAPKVSDEDAALIRKEYERGDIEQLTKQIGKKKSAIKEWARRHGLKRKASYRKGNLKRLFDGSLSSYYWLGMYAADGYASKSGHFMLSQASKDKDRVDALAVYLETGVYEITKKKSYKPGTKHYRVNIYDKETVTILRQMFGIETRKTETTIKLDFITDQAQARAFLIGFIDGDGSIDKNRDRCKIECHFNMLSSFHTLKALLPKYFQDCNIKPYYRKTKDKTYAHMLLRRKHVRKLRQFIQKYDLPHSARKWDQTSISSATSVSSLS